MNGIYTRALGIALIVLLPAAARAEGNLHVGQLKVNPFVSVAETFGDNVYFTSTDERNDSITTTTPGINLQLPFRTHSAGLEYYSVFTRYKKYTEENTTDGHAKGDVNMKFGSLFGLKLSDAYDNGHEPRSSSSTGFIEKYMTNAASASATYQLAGRSKLQIDYAKSLWRFKTSDYRNRGEDLASGYLYYRFLPKTSVFLEYDHKQTVFSQSDLDLDNKTDSVLAGLTWEISDRAKGTIKGGATRKDYKSSDRTDFRGWTGSAEVQEAFSEDTSFSLTGKRSINESSVTDNRYLLTTGAYAELTHRLLRKLSIVFRGSYGQDNYSDPIPPDTTIRVDRTTVYGTGLKYALKEWVQFTVDYNRKDRRSNIPEDDYLEHEYIFTANMSM
jgi:polysaccharide biosynthesis protein VpsM